jgi:hypothetical protein
MPLGSHLEKRSGCVARRVRQRLRHDEVRRRLDRRRHPLARRGAQLCPRLRALHQRAQRRCQAAVGQDGRVDPARKLAQLGGRSRQLDDRLVQRRQRDIGLPVHQARARDLKHEPEVDEPLLRAVVQIALDPPALGIRRRDDARPRRAQLRLRALALGDVAQIAGEHRLAREVDPRYRQLDGELGPVLAHAGYLDPPADHALLLGFDVAQQPVPVTIAQRRRHDQLRHLAPDRLLGAVAERLLGRPVELDDVAAMVDRDHAVERRRHDRALPRVARAHAALCAPADQELPELRANAFHRREQLRDGNARVARVELNRTEHAAR